MNRNNEPVDIYQPRIHKENEYHIQSITSRKNDFIIENIVGDHAEKNTIENNLPIKILYMERKLINISVFYFELIAVGILVYTLAINIPI